MSDAALQVVTDDTERALSFVESIQDAYTYNAKTFVQWLRSRGLPMDYNSVREYITELNQTNYAAGTKRIKRQAVKNRLRALADHQGLPMEMQYQFDKMMARLDRDPDTKAPKLQKGSPGVSKKISPADYQQLLRSARSDRQRLFMQFLWSTGCRVSELTGARLDACKREGKVVVIRVLGKGSKERHIKIMADLYDRIRAEFNGGTYLFETAGGKQYRRAYVSDQVAKTAERVLGRRVSAHKFRHSFVSHQIQTHPDKISAISAYVGHSSVATTLEIYNHQELTDSDLFGEAAL